MYIFIKGSGKRPCELAVYQCILFTPGTPLSYLLKSNVNSIIGEISTFPFLPTGLIIQYCIFLPSSKPHI